MQFIQSDLFERFPGLTFVIPHGGGAVPYHWGSYRGIAQDQGWPPIEELLANVFFDTCVYHQRGIDLLLDVIGPDNVIFARSRASTAAPAATSTTRSPTSTPSRASATQTRPRWSRATRVASPRLAEYLG